MYRVTAILMACAIALAAAVSLVPAQRAAAIPTSAYCLEPVEVEMLNLINQFRAENGLSALVASQTAGAAAEHHSINMAEQNFFSHTGQDGSSHASRLREHGYGFNTFTGENIAAGNASASATFTQWKNSSGHRANMLSPNYGVIGIGRAFSSGSEFGYYWTTTFGGVVDGAAARCDGSAPAPQPTTAPQPQPTTAPQPQPTTAPSGGSRSIRGGSTTGGNTGGGGGSVEPTPRPRPTTNESGPRSIRR